MAQNKSEVPAGFPKQTITFTSVAQITSTQNPLFKFTLPVGATPLALRLSGTFDFTTGNETYVLSLEDDTVKISTDNSAIAATGYTVIEATFATGTQIAKDSALEIIVTLGGTTPTLDGAVITFDYIEGGL